MGTKTISIMDDAYELLLSKKRKSESFSEVIRRIAGRKIDVMQLAGAWHNVSDSDIEDIKKNILDLRKKATAELLGKKR